MAAVAAPSLVAQRSDVKESTQSNFEVPGVIDPDGYRPNVGIVLLHADGRVFWARRVSRDGWQFPQGGMNSDETPLEAMYRELREETGLLPEHVDVLASTPGWLRYRLPNRFVRRHERPTCIGQKQVWFLLHFQGTEADLRLDLCEDPEFDSWTWVDYWHPLDQVVPFKREVYERALRHLAPHASKVSVIAEAAQPTAATIANQSRAGWGLGRSGWR